MRKIVAGKLQTGADFEGSKWGCVCSGSTAVANSHNAGPAYCVGYCGNNGVVTRNANANVRKNGIRCKKTSYKKGRFVIESPFFFLEIGKNLLCKNALLVSWI